MEKTIIKKILAILAIVMLISSDFLILGNGLISYAAELSNTTSNSNVEFSAYFKNEEGERTDTLDASINAKNLKLYVEVAVKNDGYFDPVIELTDSNFKIKDNVTSNSIASIEGNKVTLKQINEGEKVEVPLDIEVVSSEKINVSMLSQTSKILLSGTYMDSSVKKADKGIAITAEKEVTLNLKPDENATAEENLDVQGKIITNDIVNIDGTDKRIIQVLVKTHLINNIYPIKQNTISVKLERDVTEEPEEIKVIALSTLETEGKKSREINDFTVEDGVVKITLKNEPDENNEIAWVKDAYDEVVVTYVYSSSAVSQLISNINCKIELYNGTNFEIGKAEGMSGYPIQNFNNSIFATTEIEPTKIYKGQLYENITATNKKEIEYTTITTLQVTSKDVADKITMDLGTDIFETEASTIGVKTRYKTIKINKDKMVALLGEDGQIEIIIGETTKKIDKNSQADEQGNIVLNLEGTTEETISIVYSNPISEGTLEIEAIKAITTENAFTREDIKSIVDLKTTNTIKALNGEKEVLENTSEAKMILQETTSKIEVTVNKDNLATTTNNTGVSIGVKLRTDGTQYDLYKNPTIKVKLPADVETVDFKKVNPLYCESFTEDTSVTGYDPVTKTITIKLNGEQTEYTESATQAYIQFDMDITLNKLAASKTDKITVTYTNENASMYEGIEANEGVIEKSIGISAPSGLFTIFEMNSDGLAEGQTTSDGVTLQQIKATDKGKEIKFNISLVNSVGEKLDNVRILGNLPTEGNIVAGKEMNSFKTTLTNVTAEGATIYYTENAEATSDVTKTSNGWTTTLSELQNAKKYLIVLESLEKASSYVASYTIGLPTTINKDLISYGDYTVIYDIETEKDISSSSSVIGLVTPKTIALETTLIATVGNDTLKNGDKVRAGEVIKYVMTVKNTGAQSVENITLEGRVPAGTVVVVPEADYQLTGASYYDELTDKTSIVEQVGTLLSGQTYTTSYEVRVNMDITDGDEITNKAIAKVDGNEIESTEITNTLQTSPVRITVKRLSMNIDMDAYEVAGASMKFSAFVENLSDQDISNLKVTLLPENYEITSVVGKAGAVSGDAINEELKIDTLPLTCKQTTWNDDGTISGTVDVPGYSLFKIVGVSNPGADSLKMMAIVEDEDGNVWRSNVCTETLKKADAEISMTSPQDKSILHAGDEVEYDITVKNTGNALIYDLSILDEIPSELTVEKIYQDGEIKLQTVDSTQSTYVKTISNSLKYMVTLDKNETATIKVVAKVNELPEDTETKIVYNNASIQINGVEKDSSEEITHTLRKENQPTGGEPEEIYNLLSGKVWLDENRDGIKDASENAINGIKIRLYDVSTNDYAKDSSGNIIEVTTNEKGEYTFSKINNGKYIVLFEYDVNTYEPTLRGNTTVDASRTSKAIEKSITINGTEYKNYAVTDTIEVSGNVTNINLGLRQRYTFDLELNKYISRIVVQNSKGTKTYEYQNSTFQKIDIHRKQIDGTVVILEYTIKVKNAGNLAGRVSSIVDYLPDGLTFSSELNADWYLSGNNLYTKSLENTTLNPGEEREIKLILTKTMTDNNVGLINNRAEIYQAYNDFGNKDIDSTPNNQVKGEDDLGSADVIIGISTGGTVIAYIMLIIINTGLIIIAIRLMIKNKIIKIDFKKGRR